MLSNSAHKKYSSRRTNWFEKLIAIIALINLVLVLFNLSYIPARGFYLQTAPFVTELYDPVKEVNPHPETENYLDKVNRLEAQILQTGLVSSQAAESLEELQILSQQMIEDNPFALANKSRTLEKIKQEMRERVGQDNAREAFATFWSQAYLSEMGWQQEIDFFNTEIRPLIETNYYRDIGKFGKFIDYFLLIDLPFIVIFALEILARTYYISRHKPQLNWLEALLRRWYDFFLVIPLWRWLRVIPVTIRLYQSGLLNLNLLRKQLNHDFAVNFAEELTELVGIQIIDQMQESIEQGDAARWLLHPETRPPYVQVNNRNEVKAIATRLVNISVYDVFPQVQPEIEALLQYNLQTSINQLPLWQQLQKIPGLSHLPTLIPHKLAQDLSQLAYKSLVEAIEDPVRSELTSRLITNFRDALEAELEKKHNLREIESLFVDMLEEIKINYVKRIAEEGGMERVKEEADRLHHLIRS